MQCATMRPIGRGFLMALLLGLGACASDGRRPTAPEPTPVIAPTAPAAPAFLTEDVLGRTAGEIDARLGAPALVRREGAGEFRRYDLARCALIVLIYPDTEGRAVAEHAEAGALATDARAPSLEDCLAAGL